MNVIPLEQDKNSIKYDHPAYKRYSQRIYREHDELTNVCLAFSNYRICSYAIAEDNKHIKKALSKFRSGIVKAGLLDEEDKRWQYVLENRDRCMAHTSSICNLVERTLNELEKESSEGNLSATRALRALSTYYGFETSQPPFKKKSFLHAKDAFEYIYSMYGPLYDALFLGVTAPREHAPELHNIFSYSDFYHHTQDLLSYYKQYTLDKVREELSGIAPEEENEMLSELMNSVEKPTRKVIQKTTVSTCAAILVERTLEALRKYEDSSRNIDGLTLYRSIDQHYLSDIALTATFDSVLKKTKGWKSYETIYARKEQALRTYSALLWGYHTLSVIEVLDEHKHRLEIMERKKRCQAGSPA